MKRRILSVGIFLVASLSMANAWSDLPSAIELGAKPATATAKPGGVFDRKLATGVKMTSHFVWSHSAGVILRPVGATRNLLALAANAAIGLLKDTALDLVLFPLLGEELDQPTSTETMDLAAWENRLDDITGQPRIRGNVELLIDGEAFFDRLVEEIQSSRESIRISTYIFDNDDYALGIGNLLKDRSADIPVDISVDGIGTLGGGLIDSVSLPGDFVAPTSIEAYLEDESKLNFHLRDNTWFMGDHTKAFVFDRKVAFLGGMNVGREYRYDWHDMMVELSGPVVGHLDHELEQSALRDKMGDLAILQSAAIGTPDAEGTGRSELRLLYTKPHDAQIYRAQVEAIRRSRNQILVENAYMADDLVIYELARARQRGVDVRVIVPSRPDSGLIDRSNILAINRLIRHGVKVYLYPGMTHVKAAIYDGWACFGTANFDKLSFKVNKEVNIGTSDPEVVAALKQRLFAVDLAIATEVVEQQPTQLTDHVYERIVDIVL